MIVAAKKFTWGNVTGFAIPHSIRGEKDTFTYRIDYFFLGDWVLSSADEFAHFKDCKKAFRSINLEHMKGMLDHVQSMMQAVVDQNNQTGEAEA